MKKFSIVSLCLILIICFTSCTGPVGPVGPAGTDGTDGIDFNQIPANATILLNENFDSYSIDQTPTGWLRASIFTGTEVTFTAKATGFTSYPQCMLINSTTAAYEREIVKAPMLTIPNKTSGKVYIRFNTAFQVNSKNKEFLFYLDQVEKVRVKFADDGNVYAYSDNYVTYTGIGSYTANIWNQVLIVLDLATSKYDVYYNGVLKASNLTCLIQVERQLDNTLISTGNAIYTDFFGILTNVDLTYSNTYTMVDDVKIYYIP